ncbi:MAG: DUF2059 domain-containing protein [Moraxella sp.]|nr:DUF2059 domain-containing protein [Moraxella sp.]
MTLKQGIIALCLSAGLVFGTHAIAQTPSDTSLTKLSQITHSEQTLKDSMKLGFISSFTQSALQSFDYLPDHKKSQIEVLLNETGEAIWQDVHTDELSKQLHQLYLQSAKKHHTQQEVDAMIEFYQTPIGQNIITKQINMMNELSNEAIALISTDTAFLEKVNQAAQKHQPIFENKAKELLK